MKSCTFLLLFFLVSAHAQLDRDLEWQFYIPSEGIEIDSGFADSHSVILVNHLDGQSSHQIIALQDWLDFTLSPQSRVSALTFTQFPYAQVVFALSQAADPFQYGDIIICSIELADPCDLLFNVQDSLGIPSHIGIDALSWHAQSPLNQSRLYISFDSNFTYENELIVHQNIYLIQLDSGMMFDDFQTWPSVNINNIGLSAPSGIKGYDIASTLQGSKTSLISDVPIETSDQHIALPSETFDYFNQNNGNSISDEIKFKAQSLSAFSASNTGWVEFRLPATSLTENESSFEIVLDRHEGDEQSIRFLIEVTGGTAAEGIDFELVTPTIGWDNNDDESQNITISPIDNNRYDGDKTVILRLVPNSFFALADPDHQEITVTIIDDDAFDLIFKDGFE